MKGRVQGVQKVNFEVGIWSTGKKEYHKGAW